MRPSLSVLADLVVLLHLLFVLFVALGGLLALRWRWVPWLHLPAALWGAVVELAGWVCPLTPLEGRLRRAAGGSSPAGGFIERYLPPLLYPAALTRELQVGLGLLVLLGNALVYTLVWHNRRRARRRQRGSTCRHDP
jgi:hypothetical protein